MLALMTDHQGWVSTVGLVTDLEMADAVRLAERSPVGSDECIHFYQIFNQQSQEMCEWLVSRPS